MSKATLVVRSLLGFAFVFFGLNNFLHFFTPPMPTDPVLLSVMTGFMATRYLFPLMSVVEILSGLMLLAGRFVPLALVMLAPILVNIVGYHLALDMKGIGAGVFLTVLELFVAYAYRSAFVALVNAKPDAASP